MSKPAVTLPVLPGGRLDELIAAYAALKPQADELATRLKGLSDAIKLELTTALPTASAIDVDHAAMPLRLSYVERWDLDAKRLKVEDPETYVRYARKGGSWQLRGRAG